MQISIALVNYYAHEALKWLQNNWREKMILLPDIYQHDFRTFRVEILKTVKHKPEL